MIPAVRPAGFVWWFIGLASWLLAIWIVIDTLSTILPIVSPLPWFDDWSTFETFFSWKDGELSFLGALAKQVNEHRIVFPRLVFFLDDLAFGGQGRISVIASFVVQALHASFFVVILQRAGSRHPGRYLIAAIIVALMFTLRQSENFFSGFQLQFVAVFAMATVSFGLFALHQRAERDGGPTTRPLVICMLAAGVSAFTMANGLLTAYILVVLAIIARLRLSIIIVYLVWAVVLAVVYYTDYQNLGGSNSLPVVLSHPLLLGAYVAAYLGSIASVEPMQAAALGAVGIVATVLAFIRVLRADPRAPNIALLGVMLFCGATALLTAIGRDQYGVVQALTGRYATPSAVFWAAQLTYWWIDPPRWPRTSDVSRRVIAAVAVAFALAIAVDQPLSKPKLRDQAFRLNDATNLLALGLDDPDVIGRVAWDRALVQWVAPLMREAHLSIFDLPDVKALGRPIGERGRIAASETCSGDIASVTPDPTLGTEGLRVRGRATEGQRSSLRVLLVGPDDRVVGLASGPTPGQGPYDWLGYAVAPNDAPLTAFAVIGDGALCRLAPPRKLSEPVGG